MNNNNLFSLTVEQKPNQLNNIKLVEYVNTNILHKLIHSNLLKQTFNNPFSSKCYDNEKQQLEKYFKMLKKDIHDKPLAEIIYKQSDIKYGRVFPKNSLGLFSLRREIRHTLARDYYIDIDIENCHPVLLYQLCQANNITCKYLKKYIDNRTEILNETMNIYKVSKDQAKQLYIQLLYFGSFDSWCKNHNIENNEPLKFIVKFKNELKTIGEIIVGNNPKLSKAIEKRKEEQNIKDYNLKGSVCSYFLQEYESRILEAIFLYLKEQNIINNDCVLCADGLMIPKDKYKPELLNDFNELIKNKLGFDLNFTQKEMNQGYTEEQVEESFINSQYYIEYNERLLERNQCNEENENGVFNDLEAAKKLYKLYPYFVCCIGDLYVFDDETGLWTDKEEIIFKIISRFTEYLYLLTINSKGEVKKTKKGYGNTTTYKRQMIPELKSLCVNNNWITETQHTSLNKLLFLNGFYDFKTSTFYNKYDPNIVFYYKIYRNYDENKRDDNYIKDVLQRVIYNQLGETVGNYFLLNIARGIAGDLMKKFFFGLGDTNAGKSTIVKACSSSFGEYIGTFNGENLCFRNSSSDEAQQMRWALLLRYKRIIFSNEIKMNCEINGNMTKKISSGGDALVGRVHGKLETEFIPHFLAVSFANDVPKISGIDTDPAINNRLKFITYNKKFVDNPVNEFELKIDENINNEILTNEFKEAFQFIIFDAYKNFIDNGKKDIEPDEIKKFKYEWVGDGGEAKTINKFLESFEITNNKDNFTLSKDIESWLINNKIGLTMTKFTMELKKYCKLNKLDNIESKDKKINGRVIKAWLGIKKIDLDDEDDEKTSLDI